MPALPAHYDSSTLLKYFDMVDEMDPKGGAMAHQVDDFANNTALGALAMQGF